MSLLQKPSKLAACGVIAGFLAATNAALAQPAQGWPSANQTNPYNTAQAQTAPEPAPAPEPAGPPEANQAPEPQAPPSPQQPAGPYQQQPGPYAQQQPGPYAQQQPGPYPQQQAGPMRPYGGPYAGVNPANPYTPPPPIPAQLTLAPGTYVTARVNQELSSEHNRQGDAFTATLVEPLVVNGVVIAEPGQTIGGQVVDVQESGRVKGLAKLGVTLTDLTLIDGQHIPLQTQLIARQANTTNGRDAGAIAATTATGAAIGAAVNWGTGAAVGAGAGLLVSVLGVLITKGAPSVIYPEQVLTFRVNAPVAISTVNAPQAFHWVIPGEYDRPYNNPEPRPRLAYAPPPVAFGPYPYFYDPFWYGPGIGFTYFGGGYRHYGGYRHWR